MVNKKVTRKYNKSAVIPKVEEQPITEEIIEPPMEVRSYLVPILFKREPVDKNVPIADIFYRKEANLIELQCHRPNYHSELEMIIAGDISIATDTGATRVISKSEAPISWITKLYQSKEFSGHPFIAGEAQEIYEA